MIVQCVLCRRVRQDGAYRLPRPGEMSRGPVAETYCPRCARTALERAARGEGLPLRRDGRLPPVAG